MTRIFHRHNVENCSTLSTSSWIMFRYLHPRSDKSIRKKITDSHLHKCRVINWIIWLIDLLLIIVFMQESLWSVWKYSENTVVVFTHTQSKLQKYFNEENVNTKKWSKSEEARNEVHFSHTNSPLKIENSRKTQKTSIVKKFANAN